MRIARVESGLAPAVLVEGEPEPHYSLEERMQHYGVPGVSVAVIEDGAIAWARAYGLADAETGEPVTTGTLFQAASMSKPVAALAALQLVQEGRLGLDQDVNEVLTGWRVTAQEGGLYGPVTLRGLLTHTAGLTVHGFAGYPRGTELPTTVQILDGVAPANSDAIRIDLEPGSRWRYSGGGYTVMQLLVSELRGAPFPIVMQRRVLDRIGMTASTYRQPLPEELDPRAATGHRVDGEPVVGKWHVYPEMAAAGLWTTPSDLARYIIEVQRAYAGESDRVLSRSMVRAMLTPELGDWGLGPAVAGHGPALRFSHGGSNEGFRGQFIGFVERRQGAVVMANSDNGSDLASEVLRSIAAEYGWPAPRPNRIRETPLTPAAAQGYVGDYRFVGRPNFPILIRAAAGRLHVHPGNDPVAVLVHVEHDRFIFLSSGAELEFQRDDRGRIGAFLAFGRRAERVSTGAESGATEREE